MSFTFRAVIYAADTMKPVYANIIAVKLVWHHARTARATESCNDDWDFCCISLRAPANRVHGERDGEPSYRVSLLERFKARMPREIIRTDVFGTCPWIS